MSQRGIESRAGVEGAIIIRKVIIVVIELRKVGKLYGICDDALIALRSIDNISAATFNHTLWT